MTHIHNNPQKAGICRREAYAWSSWREYAKKATMVVPDLVFGIAGGAEAFLAFSESADEGKFLEDDRKNVLQMRKGRRSSEAC